MVTCEKLYVLVILSTVWRAITMTMLAKSIGPARKGFFPDDNATMHDAKSLTECQLKCDRDPLCMSAFYSNLENKCSLQNVSFVDTTVLLAKNGWRYLQSVSDKCPQHYIYAKTFGMCYKLHRNENLKMDYPNFKATCNDEGAGMLKITSDAFAGHIKDFMTRHENALVIFAISGHHDGSHWIHDDGTPVTYFRWVPGKPHSGVHVYKQIYLIARREFRWNNKAEINPLIACGFICGKYIG